jgi:hypothetical protein
VVAAGVLTRRSLAIRVWRGYLWCIAPALAAIGGFVVVQRRMTHAEGYYSHKYLDLAVCLLAVGLGVLTRLLASPRRPGLRWVSVAYRGSVVRGVAAVMPGVLVAVGVAAGFGLVKRDSPFRPFQDTNWAWAWYDGRLRNEGLASMTMAEYRRAPRTDGVAFFVSEDPFKGYVASLFLAMLKHDAGVSEARFAYPSEEPSWLESTVMHINVPVKLIADSDTATAWARTVQARHPDRRIDVVRASPPAVGG